MVDYKKELGELILIVAKENASDLHLAVGRHPTLRIAGTLVPLIKKPILAPDDVKGLVLSMLSEEDQGILARDKDVDFSFSFEDKVRFRGNAFYQKGFLGSALRLIPANVKSMAELSLPEALTDFTRREQGFFLVVGPVGHGKSTTLAAMIDYINHERAENIITVEDPIEYIFTQDKSIINQREIRSDAHDFQTALRSMFRQDINVGMIGEMRDRETISTAVTAAETGHLIFSSLHTNNAAQTIDRIIDSFPSDQQGQISLQLSGAILGIFSQRLIPRISGGLIPAYELLIANNAVRNLIRENRTHEIDLVIETGFEDGMMSLNRSLAALLRQGEITTENAYAYSLSPNGLEGLI